MKNYLVLGASGLLGSKLLKSLPQSHGTFFKDTTKAGINMSFLDMNNLESFKLLVDKIKPDVVINCVGMANVDMCEQLPEKCWKLNCWLPLKIAQECHANSIKYVHISTDHFLNASGVKLKETDGVIPLNQYGYSKLSAERFISSINKNSILIRSNFFHFNLNSPKTFLDSLIQRVKNKKATYSFSDVFFTPISTLQLATYIQNLVDLDFAGIINVAGSEVLSKFEFHSAVLANYTSNLEFHLPALLDGMALPAVRPHYMALDNNLLQTLLGIKVPSIYDMIVKEIQFSE
jgi:dTDP-4-dehydrorhamnose reductase